MREAAHLTLPVFQEGVLLLDGLEAPALERGGLGVADGVLHRALAIGVSHPSRVGHHVVVGQRGGVDRVEGGLVQVGLQDAFLQIVQHHVRGQIHRSSARPARAARPRSAGRNFQTTRRKLRRE